MSISDGVYGFVSGTVGRMFDTKNGSAFVIEVKREGAEWPDRVTVWSAPAEPRTGDRVTVKGWLSWKRTVRDEKTYFDVSVNKPELTEHEPATTPEPAGWSEPPQGFNDSDSVPF